MALVDGLQPRRRSRAQGVYWRPVYAVLEGHFEIVVGNAHHIKNVPGRKTDVKDCEWIGDLGRHGLIAKSFVPPQPIRELRELTRYRRTAANLVRRLNEMGYDVALQPKAA